MQSCAEPSTLVSTKAEAERNGYRGCRERDWTKKPSDTRFDLRRMRTGNVDRQIFPFVFTWEAVYNVVSKTNPRDPPGSGSVAQGGVIISSEFNIAHSPASVNADAFCFVRSFS